jgi:hypothetical protein
VSSSSPSAARIPAEIDVTAALRDRERLGHVVARLIFLAADRLDVRHRGEMPARAVTELDRQRITFLRGDVGEVDSAGSQQLFRVVLKGDREQAK